MEMKSLGNYTKKYKYLLFVNMEKFVRFREDFTYNRKGGMLMGKHEHSKVNGNMANSMEELIVLGKEMEQMREENGTNGQPETNDPIQFDHEEEIK